MVDMSATMLIGMAKLSLHLALGMEIPRIYNQQSNSRTIYLTSMPLRSS